MTQYHLIKASCHSVATFAEKGEMKENRGVFVFFFFPVLLFFAQITIGPKRAAGNEELEKRSMPSYRVEKRNRLPFVIFKVTTFILVFGLPPTHPPSHFVRPPPFFSPLLYSSSSKFIPHFSFPFLREDVEKSIVSEFMR